VIIILSSFVATGHAGGGAQLSALARLEATAALAPTVLFGRHPGLGAPGGGPVSAAQFEAVIGGMAAAGAFEAATAVICGYFAEPAQVEVAARALDDIRKASPGALIVVDPVMGDAPKGLYVAAPVAAAIAASLVSRADLIAPNAWELQRLTGCVIADGPSALAAARETGRSVLVSSVPAGRRIGVLWTDGEEAWLASHRRAPDAVKGTGDLLTALFAAALVDGAAPPDALETAVSDVAGFALGEEVEVTVERLSHA
jgi:pyridoxine kinase